MRLLKDLLTPISVLVLAGVVAYDRVTPGSAFSRANQPAINGEALGRAYAPVLAAGYGDAWVAAADALEKGATVAEAQKTLQAAWKDTRVKGFRKDVLPVFALVLPEGTEPTDKAKRAQVADLWRSFARGLKRAR